MAKPPPFKPSQQHLEWEAKRRNRGQSIFGGVLIFGLILQIIVIIGLLVRLFR